MKLTGPNLELSATDLSNLLGCRHRAGPDLAVAHGGRRKPYVAADPLLELLWARGREHEASYVESLKISGHSITDLREFEEDRDTHVIKTLEVMRAGADIIVQGALRDGRWFGKPDVLRRISTPSVFGSWSYEVIDTKLSKETKAGTILQLGLYSEMLGEVQEVRPEYFYVVTPDKLTPQHNYRLDDFAAYFRLIRAQTVSTLDLGQEAIIEMYYPEPVEHCEICRWERQCKGRRREDDHLSLVAGISRLNRRELEARSITTLAQLARIPIPRDFKPTRGSKEKYVNVREQARLQLGSRDRPPPPLFELRDIVKDQDEGLCRLPEPSAGDIFLDLEGDRFAVEGGREYLFGVVTLKEDGSPEYQSFWGFTEHHERESFERVMDLISAAWQKHPD